MSEYEDYVEKMKNLKPHKKETEPSGLECLKDIKELFTCHDFDLLEKCSVIENELKESEEYRLKYAQTHTALCKSREENAKKDKALEIMKKEPFISANWYLEGTYEEYINAIEVVKITEDEWNFVKEVLS